MGGSSGGGGSTVTQVQQIPAWQEGYIKANEEVATALGSQAYPTYEGDLVAGFSPMQQQGLDMTQQAATAGNANLQAASDKTQQLAGNTWDANTAAQYMNPYAMSALQPQIQALNLQQQQQSKDINKSATMAGAFGDAQFGNAQALNNFYGNLSLNDLVSQGMNKAYDTGLSQYNTQQNQGLQQAQEMASLGGQQQEQGLAGAQSMFDMGTQQQQLSQTQLNTAYQNFMNQVNWPYEQLNARIAAAGNNQYQVPTSTLAPTNATASNLGTFAQLAGSLGSLTGS